MSYTYQVYLEANGIESETSCFNTLEHNDYRYVLKTYWSDGIVADVFLINLRSFNNSLVGWGGGQRIAYISFASSSSITSYPS